MNMETGTTSRLRTWQCKTRCIQRQERESVLRVIFFFIWQTEITNCTCGQFKHAGWLTSQNPHRSPALTTISPRESPFCSFSLWLSVKEFVVHILYKSGGIQYNMIHKLWTTFTNSRMTRRLSSRAPERKLQASEVEPLRSWGTKLTRHK